MIMLLFGMKKNEIKKFMEEASYSTLYLPIVNIKSNKTFAYEALSKFEIDGKTISSADFFNKLHHNDKVFFYLESKNKKLQLKGLKKGKKLLLHFDMIVFRQKEYRKYWKEFFKNFKDHIIIDITHNSILTLDERAEEESFIKWLIKNEFEFSISLYIGKSMDISFQTIKKASYVKINKELILEAIVSPTYINLLKAIVLFCNENQIKTLASHIDNKEELKIAKKIGVDYVKGSVLQ